MVTDTPLPILIPQISKLFLFDFSSFLLIRYATMNYEM
ncbi:unnamed protein product [Musa hybrid cultivar]